MTIRNFNFNVRRLSPRTQTLRIFRSAADTSAPAALTSTQLNALSYNYSTGVLSGLPSGWQQTPAEVLVTTTTALFYSYDIVVTESVYGGSQTFSNLGSPDGVISFGNDIQSDNYVTLQDGWNIGRDTGDAEFNNVLIRGNSTVTSSTIGGDAAVLVGTVTDDIFNIDPPVTTITGVLFEGVVEFPGVFNFRPNFISLTLENSISAGTRQIDFDSTWEELDADGNIVNTTIFSETVDQSSISASFFRSFTIADRSFNVTSAGGTIRLRVSFGYQESGITMTGASLTQNSFVTVARPTSGTSAFITSGNAEEFAATVAGGFGLAVPKQLIWRGSMAANTSTDSPSQNTLQLLLNTLDHEPQVLMQVEWDDASVSPGLTVFTGALVLLNSSSPGASPESTSSVHVAIWSSPIFAFNNKYVGVASGISLPVAPNAGDPGSLVRFGLNAAGADSQISNIRMTNLWYLHSTGSSL